MYLKSISYCLFLSVLGLLAACQGDKKKFEQQEKELKELRELVEMDRREMEKQYTDYSSQYDELKKSVKNDSLLAKLTAEQERANQLLAQLRATKKNDAAEIKRLKQELESVRAVLRSYIMQVDSLTRENSRLTAERNEARLQLGDANTRISSLDNEKNQLSEKVAIAAQLDASNISISALKKNNKTAKKSKDIAYFSVAFTINRNVTAPTGNRHVYLRLSAPNGILVGNVGTFSYENRILEASANKIIEYTGEEQRVNVIVNTENTYLSAGTYLVHIFCDKQMIGNAALHIEK